MEFGHLVVWLDHAEAHIIHFNRERAICGRTRITSMTSRMP
jgi:hypothetical protein